jgi:hypothetical protein
MGNRTCGLLIGLLLLAALILNLSMLPYPIWFKTLNLLEISAAILLGDRSSIHRATPDTNARHARSA